MLKIVCGYMYTVQELSQECDITPALTSARNSALRNLSQQSSLRLDGIHLTDKTCKQSYNYRGKCCKY